MKAFKEVGTRKTIRFILYSFYEVLLHRIINHLLFFPPIRKLSLQILGAKIGSDTIIMDTRFFNWHHKGPRGLKIGKNCYLSDEVLIDLYSNITMEDHVTIAQRVLILTHTNVGYKDHPLQKYFPSYSKPVVIKKGSFIGANSTVLPGVTIGENSFVSAGSVVTKNIPPGTVYAGVPAKYIRKIKP